MPTTLSTSTFAIEKSTFVVTAVFTDSAGLAVVPTTLTWKLTDRAGTVINSRSAVTITPASTVDIVLTGDDLAFQAGEGSATKRVVTVSGTYTSDEGTGLSIKDECIFALKNLIAIS